MAVAFGPMGIHDALILGLDPGRDKIGFAAVALTKELLFSGVFPAKELGAFLEKVGRESCSAGTFSPWLRECLEEGTRRAPRAVVLGDGTCCHVLMKALKAASLPCRVVCVDERGTTLEARELYWRLHRPRPWQLLLPHSMRVPPRSLDDLAAWAIAIRGVDATTIPSSA